MRSRKGYDDREGRAVRQMDVAGCSTKSQRLDAVSAELIAVPDTKKDRGSAFDRAHLGKQIVIAVKIIDPPAFISWII